MREHKEILQYFPIFKQLYLTTFSEFYDTTYIPRVSKNALVIVEPRQHENLEFVIKNAIYYCRGWSMYIFHSKENKQFIMNFIGNKDINLIEISDSNITLDHYNKLLCSIDRFWDKINADIVLIFQTDSYIRRRGIEEYLEYDYIGAPWIFKPFGLVTGNGGFSLRRISHMKMILRNYKIPNINEDLYFSHYVKVLKMKTPSYDKLKAFAVESIYYDDPIGVHDPLLSDFDKGYSQKDEQNKKGLFYFVID